MRMQRCGAKLCSACTHKLGAELRASSAPTTPFGMPDSAGRPGSEEATPRHDVGDGAAPEGIEKQVAPAVKKRYREGYLYARAIVGAGIAVQVLGVIIGCILVLIGFVAGAAVAGQGVGPLDGGVAAASGVIMGAIPAALGVFFGGILFVFGILIKASGQFLKAQLDSAVNSSPFLNNRDRAEMMSLLGSAGANVVGGSRDNGDPVDSVRNQRNRYIAAYSVGGTAFLFFPVSLLWTIPVILWALMSTDSPSVKFQVYQCILLNVTILGAFLLFWLFALTLQSNGAVGFALVILVAGVIANLACIVKAMTDDSFSLPILGDIARKWTSRRRTPQVTW